MVYVNTYEVVANCLEEEGCNYRAVNSAGKCEKNFLVSDLLAYELYLVCNEVLHVPVSLSLAYLEYESLHSFFNELFVICELRKLHFAECLVVTSCHYRETCLVNLRKNVNSYSVDNIVGTTVDDDSLYVWQSLELSRCDVVRVDFAINSQCTNCSCYHGVLMATKIKDDDHILFHIHVICYVVFMRFRSQK